MNRTIEPLAPGLLLVGARGLKGSGKDTALSILGEHLNANGLTTERLAFGDAIKHEIAEFMATMLVDHPKYGKMPNSDLRRMVLGWQHGPTRPEKEQMRLLMQWWGGEFRRGMFNKDYWLDRFALAAQASATVASPLVILVPDVRFPDEAALIQKHGLLLNIVRPGLKSEDQHLSERALRRFTGDDFTILNGGGMEALRYEIERIVPAVIAAATNKEQGNAGA